MYTRTKIIATLGPATDSYEKIFSLIEAGVNVTRLNFSHGSYEEHKKRIEWVKKARKEQKKAVAIMLDTKGPEIRVDHVLNKAVELKPKDLLKITENPGEDPMAISIHPISVLQSIGVGTKILFNDGYISSTVVEKREKEVLIEIENKGTLALGKGVNIPKASLHLPAFTEEDKKDIEFGCKEDIDIVAASFIRSSEHVLSLKKALNSFNKPEILVIAKIENSEGVENFDSILQVADGIMVARGDLGVEMDLGEIPRLQKKMIRKCYQANKPVITATQMLESMIFNPRPTRAEVSDVANAIYDSTSAVMLSAETAIGKYPIETVEIMKKIIYLTEQDFSYRAFFEDHSKRGEKNVSAAVALAAVQTAYATGAKAIFAFTSSGFTARLVSRLRPKMPIIALTNTEKNFHQLGINWGVMPLFKEGVDSVKEAFSFCQDFASKEEILSFGDVVVVTAGSPFGITGSTNTVLVESIGNILIRAARGYGKKVTGKVCFYTPSQKETSFEGAILVIPYCSKELSPVLQKVKGIILDNHKEDTESEKEALTLSKTYNIPLLVQAAGAINILQEEEVVTLDPSKALVYRS